MSLIGFRRRRLTVPGRRGRFGARCRTRGRSFRGDRFRRPHILNPRLILRRRGRHPAIRMRVKSELGCNGDRSVSDFRYLALHLAQFLIVNFGDIAFHPLHHLLGIGNKVVPGDHDGTA